MTVTTSLNYKEYQADGIASRYAIPFLLFNYEDLQVFLDNKQITSGYQINGLGNPISEIVFTQPPTGHLLLQRSVNLLRETDYQENGDLLASTINQDFDRIYLILQGFKQNESQSLRVIDAEGINLIAAKEERADKILSFDSQGQPLLITSKSGSASELAQQLASLQGAGLIGFDDNLSYPTATAANALSDATKTIKNLTTQLTKANQAIAKLKEWQDQERFIFIYPNDGSEDSPAIVEANKRYILDNPFPNCPVICQAELLVNDVWAETGWFYATGGQGTAAGHIIESDQIIVQTGSNTIFNASSSMGGFHGYIGVGMTRAPCRVKVWRIG